MDDMYKGTFNEEQENTLRSQDDAVRKVFTKVPQLNSKCGKTIGDNPNFFASTNEYNYDELHCQKLYQDVFVSLFGTYIKTSDPPTKLDINVENYHVEQLFRKTESAKVHQALLKAVDKIKYKKQKQLTQIERDNEITEKIFKAMPVISNLCKGNRFDTDYDCIELRKDILFKIYGTEEYKPRTIIDFNKNIVNYHLDKLLLDLVKPGTLIATNRLMLAKINEAKRQNQIRPFKVAFESCFSQIRRFYDTLKS